MKHEIVFRKIEPREFLRTGVMAPAWGYDASLGIGHEPSHCYVEYRAGCRPIALAGRAFVIEWPDPVRLDWLWVDEESRRRGVGTKLVEACRDRWPGIKGITSEAAITTAGERFCNALGRGGKTESQIAKRDLDSGTARGVA